MTAQKSTCLLGMAESSRYTWSELLRWVLRQIVRTISYTRIMKRSLIEGDSSNYSFLFEKATFLLLFFF